VTRISTTEELFNAIQIEEKDATSLDDKILQIRSTIQTTKEVAKDYERKIYPEPFIIKRKRRVDSILLAAMAVGFTFMFGFALYKQTNFNLIGSLFIVGLLGLIYYAFYKNLTLPYLNYTITLTRQQIDFGDIAFLWGDIQETFIVSRPKGYFGPVFLIIGLKSGELNRHHINNLMTYKRGEREIARAIEYFRNYA